VAASAGDAGRVREIDRAIDDAGGRALYQAASRASTSHFSTSRWVLRFLARSGWMRGRPDAAAVATATLKEGGGGDDGDDVAAAKLAEESRRKRKGKEVKRPTRILEIGAINTELLDAAKTSTARAGGGGGGLRVRAIDLRSAHAGIEEADFLAIPLARRDEDRYDAIVCSMVLNCVPGPARRGEMLRRMRHFLLPGGLCFVTLPKSCLALSPYTDRSTFRDALELVGLDVVETKESPKIAFYVCRRPGELDSTSATATDTSSAAHQSKLAVFQELRQIRWGRKYTNDFSIVLK
jgi:25S rRNA (adenine2142-N1)-methyltransferase